MSAADLTTLTLLAIPAAGSSLYLLLLTLLSGRPRPPPRSRREVRFDIVIPAHNEEGNIANVVRSAQAIDWPADRFRVVVVADNCSDNTAQIAADCGAQVLVRRNTHLRGKGYALEYAFAESRSRQWAEAVAVIDADSRASTNFLEAIATRLEQGEQAVQVHYGVANIHASWRTRLMAIAMAAFHRVRSRGRERLGVSCGIRGNGWALTHAVLEIAPFASYSLAEDLEYGIELGLRGIRVAYADEAWSDGDMVSGARDSSSQRRRWEQGRMELLRARTGPLLRSAVTKRSLLCLDLALDLLVLPLSYIALLSVLLSTLALLLAPAGAFADGWFLLGASCCASITLYILRGWQLSATGARGLLDLLRAPFFVTWKVAVMISGKRTTEWVRTRREGR